MKNNLPFFRVFLYFLLGAVLCGASYKIISDQPPALISENGKFGYINDRDSTIVSPQYDYAEKFISNYSWAVVATGNYYQKGSSLIEGEVNFIGKFGFIDHLGREIFPPQFDIVLELFNEYAIVGQGDAQLVFTNWPDERSISFSGKMGLVSAEGNFVLKPEYTDIKPIYSDECILWKTTQAGEKLSLYKDSVKIHLPDYVDEILDFSSNRARVRIHNKYGFIAADGKLAIKSDYSNAKSFDNNLAFVQLATQYYHIDTTGNIVDDKLEFEAYHNPTEGYSMVQIFGKFGFIDQDSILVIPPLFTEALPFFKGLAPVMNENQFGYIMSDASIDTVDDYREGISLDTSPLSLLVDFPNESFRLSISEDTLWYHPKSNYLNFEMYAGYLLESFRLAPRLYYQYPDLLPEICAGEGSQAGRYIFNREYLTPGNAIWEKFKKSVLLKIIGTPQLRDKTWEFLMPYFKHIFLSMPEYHQQVYRNMIEYLEKYYSNYEIEKVQEQLLAHEADFAYEHWDSTKSPFRKTSAQIDRLILRYRVIDEKEVKKILRKSHKEMDTWQLKNPNFH